MKNLIYTTNIAKQLAHDIRSPLSALNMVVSTLNDIPEEKRILIRQAAQRINDIANGLLAKGKAEAVIQSSGNTTQMAESAHSGNSAQALVQPSTAATGSSVVKKKNESARAQTEITMMVALIDQILSEKRLQYRDQMNVLIEGQLNQSYGLFAKVNPSEFARVLSNLINNSVEAFENQSGKVTVLLRSNKETNQIEVLVEDNGKGIPEDLLQKLGERGVTFGKNSTDSGTGLGLAHAKETVLSYGGDLRIQSEVNKGTTVLITLPIVKAPYWFVERVTLRPGQIVVTVDDDRTIHQIWQGRLKSAVSAADEISQVTFASPEALESWSMTESEKDKSKIYLVDYEFLGHTKNGLDLIEQLNIADKAILVTSRYEEASIVQRAEDLGVKILPKGLSPHVPIEIWRMV